MSLEYTVNKAPNPIPEMYPQSFNETPEHPLDTDDSKKIHRKLIEWWTQARETQSINRYQMSIDCDFYDGLQWADSDAEELRNRGQAPLIYNRIKPAVDWVTGTEKRSRFDYKVQARKDEHCEAAEAKTGLLKYLSDVNKMAYARSRAFEDAVIAGVGWLEDGIRGDPNEELIFSRWEPWRNMWYDPLSVERDLSDARFIFRSKYVDLDTAKAMFPERIDILNRSASTINNTGEESDDEFSSLYNQQRDSHGNIVARRSFAGMGLVFNRRQRVRLIECWYREVEKFPIMRGEDPLHGIRFDPNNPEHTDAVQNELVSVYDSIQWVVKLAIMTPDALLELSDSPYRHNKFPFTPIWGYRRRRDNAPYGIVRNIRDPQESLNKRMSKALHILSTRLIVAEADASTDWETIREEAARPDGIILLDGRREARFDMSTDTQLAREHVNLMDIDKAMIQDVSGVTDENLGRDTNAVSGRAVTARQEQGSVITAALFDNLSFAMQLQGEKLLSMIEQFYDATKTIRIIGDNGEPEFKTINQPELDPITGEVRLMNDVVSTQADFIMDQQEYRASQRRAAFDMFGELFKSLDPELTIQLMDLMFEYSDLPGKDEIVSRIRKLNGQTDPSKKNDPEEVARLQQQAAEQQAKKEMEMRAMQLELDKTQAAIDKAKADAEKVRAETVGTNVQSLFEAISAGEKVALIPQVAMLGDRIAASAGYVDKDAAPLIPVLSEAAQMPIDRSERVLLQGQYNPEVGGAAGDTSPNTPPNPPTGGEGIQSPQLAD